MENLVPPRAYEKAAFSPRNHWTECYKNNSIRGLAWAFARVGRVKTTTGAPQTLDPDVTSGSTVQLKECEIDVVEDR